MIPRIGAKSLALLCELKGEKLPDVEMLHRKAKRFQSFLSPGTVGLERPGRAPCCHPLRPGEEIKEARVAPAVQKICLR